MSVPNRTKNGIADPVSYAPRWVRQSQPIAPERSTSTHASSTAPVITTGATPGWSRLFLYAP
jgi:hypothetical protein